MNKYNIQGWISRIELEYTVPHTAVLPLNYTHLIYNILQIKYYI